MASLSGEYSEEGGRNRTTIESVADDHTFAGIQGRTRNNNETELGTFTEVLWLWVLPPGLCHWRELVIGLGLIEGLVLATSKYWHIRFVVGC